MSTRVRSPARTGFGRRSGRPGTSGPRAYARGSPVEATIWGGDWNQALGGRDYVGSLGGREQILALLNGSQLSVPTSPQGGASKGHRPINHIAIPITWDVTGVNRVQAAVEGCRLSDHDAYVVSVDR